MKINIPVSQVFEALTWDQEAQRALTFLMLSEDNPYRDGFVSEVIGHPYVSKILENRSIKIEHEIV